MSDEIFQISLKLQNIYSSQKLLEFRCLLCSFQNFHCPFSDNQKKKNFVSPVSNFDYRFPDSHLAFHFLHGGSG